MSPKPQKHHSALCSRSILYTYAAGVISKREYFDPETKA